MSKAEKEAAKAKAKADKLAAKAKAEADKKAAQAKSDAEKQAAKEAAEVSKKKEAAAAKQAKADEEAGVPSIKECEEAGYTLDEAATIIKGMKLWNYGPGNVEGTIEPAYVVTCPRKNGMWRIGRKFSPEPTTLPVSELSDRESAVLDRDSRSAIVR